VHTDIVLLLGLIIKVKYEDTDRHCRSFVEVFSTTKLDCLGYRAALLAVLIQLPTCNRLSDSQTHCFSSNVFQF